jgi:hypothetical protein
MCRAMALLAAFVAAACFESPTAPDVVAGKPFELRAGAAATLPDGLTTITFERVTGDSRCPADVNCVWAGEATVAISVSNARGDAEKRELKTSPGGSSFEWGSYTVSLTALTPYPRTTQQIPPDDYVATLVVAMR